MGPTSVPASPLIHTASIPQPTTVATDSIWDRISRYVSEHKAVVYTIGAVVVVAGAGGIYYVSQNPSSRPTTGGSKEKKAKKDRRKRDKDTKDGSRPDKSSGMSFPDLRLD